MTESDNLYTEEEKKLANELKSEFDVVWVDINNIPWYRFGYADKTRLIEHIDRIKKELLNVHTEQFSNDYKDSLNFLEGILDLVKDRESSWPNLNLLAFLIGGLLFYYATCGCCDKNRYKDD